MAYARPWVLLGLVWQVGLSACVQPRDEPVDASSRPQPGEVPDAAVVPEVTPDGAAGTADTRGPVVPEGPIACGPVDGVCPAGCGPARDRDCVLAAGSSCTDGAECESRICSDGTCCAEACPTCQACRGPGGSCVNIAAGLPDSSDPGTCTEGRLCDGSGQCRSPHGQPCLTESDCLSSFCVDGICCNEACTGACRSCALGDEAGTCSEVVNATDPPVCSGGGFLCVGQNGCGQVDQRQDGTVNGNGSIAGDEILLAQSFTMGRSGRLVGIRARIFCLAGNVLETSLRPLDNGLPSESQVAVQVTEGEFLANQSGDYRLVVFSSPPRIERGTRLAIVFRAQGHCSFESYYAGFEQGPVRDTYPGGTGFIIDRPEIPSWREEENSDLAFETLIEPDP